MNQPKLNLSLTFILIYVALANAGTILSAMVDTIYLGQILLLSVFSFCLVIYVRKRELTRVIGLVKVGFSDAKENLLYLPLVLIIFANGVFFFDRTIAVQDMLLSIGFMILVAFLEEILFRGLLFKSIEKGSSTKIAILVSGATFGFGHIINLFNGYTGINQIIQIVIAVVIGIVLSVLFVRTKSIVPGIIFHFFFNIASALSATVKPMYDYISVGVILLIASIYLAYLLRSNLHFNSIK